jgi:hypothetical protein
MKFFDYFYREELTLEGAWAHRWDVFLSAWDGSDRVRQVFSHVASAQKFWIIHPEYQIATADLPVGPRFEADGGEAASMQGLVRHLETLCDVRRARLCIDITGMLRPHIAVLLRILKHEGSVASPNRRTINSESKRYFHLAKCRTSEKLRVLKASIDPVCVRC